MKKSASFEAGSWVLDGLMSPQPTTEIRGRREARVDSFLARDGLRKTIKYRKQAAKRSKGISGVEGSPKAEKEASA